jgi:hypothetical protein
MLNVSLSVVLVVHIYHYQLELAKRLRLRRGYSVEKYHLLLVVGSARGYGPPLRLEQYLNGKTMVLVVPIVEGRSVTMVDCTRTPRKDEYMSTIPYL